MSVKQVIAQYQIPDLLFYFLSSLAYVISGKLGLMLAIAPGNAAPVFLPAGIAVAVMLIGGWRALPWIFIAALIVAGRIGHSAGLIIAIAATLQAAIGGSVLRRIIGYPTMLDQKKEVLRLLIAIPLICLVSASLSVTALWLLDIIEGYDFLKSFATWWVGDTLGVMVMFPLSMIMAGEPRALWRSRLMTVAMPILAIFIIFVLIYIKFSQWGTAEALYDFRQLSQQSVDHIQENLEDQATLLEQVSAFFLRDANHPVTRDEFHRFVQKSLHHFPMIQALEWVPYVDASGRAKFVAAQRHDFTEFDIAERDAGGFLQRAADRASYYPVTYLEPYTGNQPALGFDLASNVIRKETIKLAIQGRSTTASAAVKLVQENQQQAGVLLLYAIHPHDEKSDLVLTVLRMGDFMDKTLQNSHAMLYTRLIDLEDQGRIYSNFAPASRDALFTQTFAFGTRHYRMETAPTPAYYAQHTTWNSWIVLVVGSLFTGLLGAFLLVDTGHVARIEAEVSDRTRRLTDSEARMRIMLENQVVGIVAAKDRIIQWANPAYEKLLGYQAEELNGVATHVIFPDEAAYQTLGKNAYPVINAGGVYRTELVYRCKDGSLLNVEVSGGQLNPETGETLWAAVDITARVKNERALQKESEKNIALLRNASDGIHILDYDGNVLEASDSFCSMLGYSREEVIGMNVSLWDAGFTDAAAKLTIVRQQFKNPNRSQFETRHRRKDGTIFDVEVSGMVLELDGKPALFNSSRDVTDRKRMEAHMLKERNFISAVVNSAGVLVVVINREGLVTHFNKLAEEFTGYLFKEIKDIPFSWERFLLPEQRQGVRSVFEGIKSGKISPSYENYWVSRNGEQRLFAWANTLLFDYENQMEYVIAVGTDISERKLAEDELRIAATAFESQEGMSITDATGIILRVNRSFTDITGYLPEDVLGKTHHIVRSGRHDAGFYAAMQDSLNSTGEWSGEIWNRRKSGEIYPEHLTITAVKNSDGIVTHYVSTLTDITLTKAAEDEIKHLAFYDPLTRLPNRRLLLDRLRQALNSVARSNWTVALLFIDLDNFKTLNDTMGHDVGDLLLQQVATRLESCVREGDTVARLGGDEFVVMLENLNKNLICAAEQTELVGNKILETLNLTYQLATHEYRNTASIGATLFNDNRQAIDELLKQADIAMYQSKQAGRNSLHFFDPTMQQSINVRAMLERELHKAVEQQQFALYYQIQTGELQEDGTHHALGAEALIRWIHPDRGLVSPAEFIPLAEESGLILPIGLWVLDTACAQLARWQNNPHSRHLTLSVNVSVKQFRQADFVAQVQAALHKHAINPALLKLELTESLLLTDIEETITTMDRLNAIGIKFSLDDFGTGYSSLQYLKRLPLYQLKIDQSFVRDIVSDSSDKAIVRTIIAMASSMNMTVIAEGVETKKQLSLLLKMGCTHYQGYLFGRPVPIEEFEELLEHCK